MATTTRTVEVELSTTGLDAQGRPQRVPLATDEAGNLVPLTAAPALEPELEGEHMLIIEVDDVDRHLGQARGLGGPKSAFAGNELIPLAAGPHHQGLQHAVCLDALGERLQLVLIEPFPGLVRIEVNPPDRELPYRTRDFPQERVQPPAETRLRRFHAHRPSPLINPSRVVKGVSYQFARPGEVGFPASPVPRGTPDPIAGPCPRGGTVPRGTSRARRFAP